MIDPRCNIIINRPHEESFIQVEECKKPLIDMDKGEVFAKMLIKKERYKEAMEIMAKCIKAKLDTRTEEETSLKLKTTCCELASCLNIHLENRQRYYAGGIYIVIIKQLLQTQKIQPCQMKT